jgi:hypothetical protein
METIPPFASDLDSAEYYPLAPLRVHSKTSSPTTPSALARRQQRLESIETFRESLSEYHQLLRCSLWFPAHLGAVLCRFSKQSNEAQEKHTPPAPNGTA